MKHPLRQFRYQTHIPVQVIRRGGPQAAYIVDIHNSGACVVGLTGVAIGEAVVLRGCRDANVATVKWAANRRSGVVFNRPIKQEHLNTMRHRDPQFLLSQLSEILLN